MKLDSIVPKSIAPSVEDDALDGGWGDEVDEGWDDAPAPPPSLAPPRSSATPLSSPAGSLFAGSLALGQQVAGRADKRDGAVGVAQGSQTTAAAGAAQPAAEGPPNEGGKLGVPAGEATPAGPADAVLSNGALSRTEPGASADPSASVERARSATPRSATPRTGPEGFKFPDSSAFRPSGSSAKSSAAPTRVAALSSAASTKPGQAPIMPMTRAPVSAKSAAGASGVGSPVTGSPRKSASVVPSAGQSRAASVTTARGSTVGTASEGSTSKSVTTPKSIGPGSATTARRAATPPSVAGQAPAERVHSSSPISQRSGAGSRPGPAVPSSSAVSPRVAHPPTKSDQGGGPASARVVASASKRGEGDAGVAALASAQSAEAAPSSAKAESLRGGVLGAALASGPPPAGVSFGTLESPVGLGFGSAALAVAVAPPEPSFGAPGGLAAAAASTVEAVAPATETLRPSNLDAPSERAPASNPRRRTWAWMLAVAGVVAVVGMGWAFRGRFLGSQVPRAWTAAAAPEVPVTAAPRIPESEAPASKPTTEHPEAQAAADSSEPASSAEAPEVAEPPAVADQSRLKDAFAAALAENPRTVKVTVTTEPAAAAVFDTAGLHLGAGTVQVSVPEGRQRRILVYLRGYREKRLNLDGKTKAVNVALVKSTGPGAGVVAGDGVGLAERPAQAPAESPKSAGAPGKKRGASATTAGAAAKESSRSGKPAPAADGNPFADVSPL